MFACALIVVLIVLAVVSLRHIWQGIQKEW